MDNDDIIEGEVADSTLPAEVLPVHIGRSLTTRPIEVGEEAGLKLYADRTGKVRKEIPRAVRAFTDYMAMGRTRSLDKLARHYTDNDPEWTNNFESVLRTLKSYSSNFDWQNRLRIQLAIDSAKLASRSRQEALESSKERLRLYKKLQTVAEGIIDKALIVEPDQISPQEARKVLKQAIEMMKLGLGGQRVEQIADLERFTPPKRTEDMTDEELDQWIAQLQSSD